MKCDSVVYMKPSKTTKKRKRKRKPKSRLEYLRELSDMGCIRMEQYYELKVLVEEEIGKYMR